MQEVISQKQHVERFFVWNPNNVSCLASRSESQVLIKSQPQSFFFSFAQFGFFLLDTFLAEALLLDFLIYTTDVSEPVFVARDFSNVFSPWMEKGSVL